VLTIYPSNQLEDLLYVLQAVLPLHQPDNPLQSDTVLVESKGMQHWLNLQLAALEGVSMNRQFAMPSGFIWDLSRQLLSASKVPRHSPYRREVLRWRLDRLLTDPEFIRECPQPARYWGAGEREDGLKRFQLACSLADVFEQYMLFRPDWIAAWEAGQRVTDDDNEVWQAWLWRALVCQQAYHPVMLQTQVLAALKDCDQALLPTQVIIFAVNTMAPQNLVFFEALSARCPVHVFHLNPCVEFWGDIQSDQAKAQQSRKNQLLKWIDADEDLSAGNPLLANLGQQGKAFFNLLQKTQAFEISAFTAEESILDKQQRTPPDSVLAAIQQDILTLDNASRQDEVPTWNDDSVVISQAHSALREIQVLHDYLLHQFNDPTLSLTPQDVLVMCPAIEDYAPMIDSVFRTRGQEAFSRQTPRLPCSISDRTLLDADPLIAAFLELLQLPDSRFSVGKILDYLHLPAIQSRFSLEYDDLQRIEWWLSEAAVHWGVDQAQKRRMAGLDDDSSAMFTWQWGLQRLLRGFAHSDTEGMWSQQWLLPHVEGQDAVLLGRLMQLLERLQQHAQALTTPRTALAWQKYLQDVRGDFFEAKGEEDSGVLIAQGINALREELAQAGDERLLSLSVVRHALQQHFGKADSANHFLVGKITFSSMMPMRSIPFKIIAILGLNDGSFPRQPRVEGFNLMNNQPLRAGDRSRRGDDRYLFLEAIISAREKFYLSYQGRNVRNNTPREASLVLKEFWHYLQHGYGWSESCIQQHPLHPFSAHCYQEPFPSFDGRWQHLGQAQPSVNNQAITLPPEETVEAALSLDQCVRFFDHPLKAFAKERLGLSLQDATARVDDHEPFVADHLSQYLIRDAYLTQQRVDQPLSEDRVSLRYQQNGRLPESPLSAQWLQSLETEAQLISMALPPREEYRHEHVEITVAGQRLSADLIRHSVSGNPLVWRAAECKPKDQLRVWLTHLLATVHAEKPLETHAYYLHKKKLACERLVLSPCEPAQAQKTLQQWLLAWQAGLCQPSLLFAGLGRVLFQDKKQHAKSFEELCGQQNIPWQKEIEGTESNKPYALSQDAYFRWFFDEIPALNDTLQQQFYQLYQPLYQALAESK
jgi:exodeoxyribonuclease V gamma subunit